MIELVLTLHFVIILYVIFGFPVVLKRNRPVARYFHAATLAIIALLMILKVPCPITILEETLRGESYQGGFITTWLNRIIYVEGFDPIYVFIATLIFAGLVFSSFFWHPVKHRRPGWRK